MPSDDGRDDASHRDSDEGRHGTDGSDQAPDRSGRRRGHLHGHRHGHGHDHDEPAPDDAWERFRRWLVEWYHGLYHSMIEAPATEKLEKEGEDVEEAFLFACFADAFGIPSPVSYYTVELLPYLAEDFEAFERRMWDRESVLERKGEQYHFH